MTSWVSKLGGRQRPPQEENQPAANGGQPGPGQDREHREDDERLAPGPGQAVPAGDSESQEPADDQLPEDNQRPGADHVVLVVREGQISAGDESGPARDEATGLAGEAGEHARLAGEAGDDAWAASEAGDSEDELVPAAGLAASPDASPSGPWHQIQALFVDDPRASVTRADGLVEERIEVFVASVDRIVASVKEKRRTLQAAMPESDTEQLRLTLHQYRELWDRLEGVSFGS